MRCYHRNAFAVHDLVLGYVYNLEQPESSYRSNFLSLVLHNAYSLLGCLNRPLALDRFLDSKCQSRLFHACWRRIFNEKGVIQARQLRPIRIFTTR